MPLTLLPSHSLHMHACASSHSLAMPLFPWRLLYTCGPFELLSMWERAISQENQEYCSSSYSRPYAGLCPAGMSLKAIPLRLANSSVFVLMHMPGPKRMAHVLLTRSFPRAASGVELLLGACIAKHDRRQLCIFRSHAWFRYFWKIYSGGAIVLQRKCPYIHMPW